MSMNEEKVKNLTDEQLLREFLLAAVEYKQKDFEVSKAEILKRMRENK